jgi:uncharacterized protein Smg (DUF494 family)
VRPALKGLNLVANSVLWALRGDEIQQALAWLEGLRFAAQGAAILPTAVAMPTPDPVRTSMRIYAAAEQDHLGYEGLRYLSFLVGAGGLSETPARDRD